jgi:hypothetical protein
MTRQRTDAIPPQAFLSEIDAQFGESKRTAFLSEVTAREVRRRRLLDVLKRAAPAWYPADHPDVEAAGGAPA